jgi:phosphoribosylformylglycinamidine synthase
MAAACRALDFPVVSGNVSLYNETNGQAILPTPAVGAVGLLADVSKRAGIGGLKAGDQLILIGETRGHLTQSVYEQVMHGSEAGPPPPVNLAVERRNGDFVRGLIEAGKITVVHDLSDGGLAGAATDMALAADVGVMLFNRTALPDHAFAYGEDQARYLLAVDPSRADEIFEAAEAAGVPADVVGLAGGCEIALGDSAIDLSALRAGYEGWLPAFMAG